MKAVLAIDQGTTSTRSLLIDEMAKVRCAAQIELKQYYPADGWVEHDPEAIWRDVVATACEALEKAKGLALDITAIGIANQRETCVLWDRESCKPIHPAIVWQDRRGADLCRRFIDEGLEQEVTDRTGLLLDSYFTASKLAWLLDTIPSARKQAEEGRLAFGTIDCFLLWRLTGGKVHATDATNASRTLLFDIAKMAWCPDLCRMFGIPMQILPEVRETDALFGLSDKDILGLSLPIAGMVGDQQGALIGQGCLERSDAKITLGTGGFAMLNSGGDICRSRHRMLSTVACYSGGVASYAIEGAFFVAGAGIKWTRDKLHLVASAAETEAMARSLTDNGGVYLVPAFVGLGAPHWNPSARAMLTGMTFATGPEHIVRAALECVAYQSADLLSAMALDSGVRPGELKVDGGMVANDWLCQFLADILDLDIVRPANIETTALGAAFLAGARTGVWTALPDAVSHLATDRRFSPALPRAERGRLLAGWREAVGHALGSG
ncbi:glycerol kinase GlpK [Sphingobium tyrosinilyticum]|uniref:Glycerol kinase GlpK n=1 Tax=Sphingobium tyrosinilyticum TaxID=2715436 RepID=A0ABV9F0G8_9SPHN